MVRYVKDYNDEFYIFKVANSIQVHNECMKNGINNLFNDDGVIRLYTYNGYLDINIDKKIFDEKTEKAVFSIDKNGIIQELYNSKSTNNAICITLQCNSNCVMCPCSEKSRKHCAISSIEYLKELLYYLPKNIEFLTINCIFAKKLKHTL